MYTSSQRKHLPYCPRLGNKLTALMLIASLSAPAAHAQWQVVDKQANSTLNQIQTNTRNIDKSTSNIDQSTKSIDKATGHIDTATKNIDNNLHIGSYSSPGNRVADPELALAQATLQDGMNRCSSVAKSQQDNCEEIIKTQNARYLYMKTMYDNTKKRNDRLQVLLKERDQLDKAEFGKLEDNTNKLVALYTLLQIDRQQMEAANHAYDARLRYLRSIQTQLAEAAATGRLPGTGNLDVPLLGNIDMGTLISGIKTGVALKVALDTAQSPAPAGMRTLRFEHSDGW